MRVATRALYRSRQFFGGIRPRIDAELLTEALRLLSEPERRLFEAMTTRDQKHCLAVYAHLRGQRDDDLLTAALLHDAGKGRIALWHRVAYVLLEAVSPPLLRRLAKSGDGPGWRQALDRCHRHPELGARLTEKAGSSSIVVALIREDSQHAPKDLLAALKAADEEA